MTPRLKLLSALLCVSIVYAVYDYIDRNNIGKAKDVPKENSLNELEQLACHPIAPNFEN